MFSLFKKRDEKKSDFELEDDDDDESDAGFTKSLQLNLSRLIVYAESADVKLQREVTFSLFNILISSIFLMSTKWLRVLYDKQPHV
jgi:hypothetical protein